MSPFDYTERPRKFVIVSNAAECPDSKLRMAQEMAAAGE
jgi:hypothetical protein